MKYLSRNFVGKVGIVCFWLLAIFAFLYAGQFASFFTQKKSINVLVWGQVLDKEFLYDFEKETGIQVNMSYFETNEELFVKLQSNSNHDYDLIMPSDWAVQLMIQKDLIKKLDHSKIHIWDNLYPALRNLYFDPHNAYSLPYYWTLFGPAVDRRYWQGKEVPATWGIIFDEHIMPPRICVMEDMRELICIAALYLFGRYDQLTMQEVEQVKTLLLQQKKYVEIYTDSRPEYILASGSVQVAVSWFGDFLKMMRQFDYIDLVIPQEGIFAAIDSFVIPATSKKDDLIYPFVNYLFSKDIVQKYVDKFDFFPAVQVNVEYDERFIGLNEPTLELFSRVNFFKNVVSKETMNDVLISLKS
jgi:spermidine/putrescine transport system substrate-binding protein